MKARSQKPSLEFAREALSASRRATARRWARAGAAVLACSSGLLAFAAPAAQRASREQRAIVSVVDKNNKVIAGLGPADFTVKEDGVTREIFRVDTADDPLQVVLLIDTSSGMRELVQDIRPAVKAFSAAIFQGHPGSEISLMEFGERPAMVADRATAQNLIDRAADRLNEHTNSGAYLLDAIVDATRNLKKRAAQRGSIVAFVRSSSSEFSNRQHEEVEKALKDCGASLWVLVLEGPQPSALSMEMQQREIVVGDVSLRSGGLRDIVLSRMGIESHLRQIGELLASQYAVVYGRPESLIPPSKLDVTTKRSGARVLAPRWTGQ